MLRLFVCIGVSLMIACLGTSSKTQRNITSVKNSKPPQTNTSQENVVQRDEPRNSSLIRQIDFSNFTFPSLPTRKCSMKKIRLENGRYDAPEDRVPRKIPSIDCWSVALGGLDYGDVTGDGEEEAFVILFAELGGNSSYEDVYIYSLQNEKPILLWKFMTGDRADGGLRDIYSEGGNLVIELYGIRTIIEKQLKSSDDVGACCPKHYTRTKYKWDGRRFRQDGKEEVFPNPSGATEILIP